MCFFWQKGTEEGLNRIDKRGDRLIISMMMMMMMLLLLMMMMMMMTAAMMVVILVLITADQDYAIPTLKIFPFPGGYPLFGRFPQLFNV